MIICHVCAAAGAVEPASRYLVTLAPGGPGALGWPSATAVDVCAAHADQFWGEYGALLGRYAGPAGEGPPSAPVPDRGRGPAPPRPEPPRRPEVGKTYGKTADDWAKIERISEDGEITCVGPEVRLGRLSEEHFVRRFGRTPIDTPETEAEVHTPRPGRPVSNYGKRRRR